MLALVTNENSGSKEPSPLFHLENDLGSGFAGSSQGSRRSPIGRYGNVDLGFAPKADTGCPNQQVMSLTSYRADPPLPPTFH
jgi:hypothetical protein